jgi:tripartite-type tricarboxylate transporter receptor subunit TctC
MMGNTAALANIPAVSKSANYDASSFVAIAKVMDSFQVLVASPEVPVSQVSELIQWLKSNPATMNYSAAGVGNLTHLSGELFKSKSHTRFEIIQYKSGAESINSILAGQTQFTIDNVSAVKSLVQEKKLRALAVTSTVRKTEMPEVPTLIESGLSDVVITSFFGVVAPSATPKAVVQKLNKVINDEMRSEHMTEQIRKLGGQVAQESPEQFQSFIIAETKKWSQIASQSNINLD